MTFCLFVSPLPNPLHQERERILSNSLNSYYRTAINPNGERVIATDTIHANTMSAQAQAAARSNRLRPKRNATSPRPIWL